MKEKYNNLIQNLSESDNISKKLESLLEDKTSDGWKIINKWDSIFENSVFSICNTYLSTDLFSRYDNTIQLKCLCILLDAEYRHVLTSEKKLNRKYEETDEIFKKFPELWKDNWKAELVNYRKIVIGRHSNIFSIGPKHAEKWGYLDPRIPISLLSWIDDNHKNQPIYIRIESNSISDSKPRSLLSEAIMIPPNPNWWKDLGIYKGRKEICSFDLLGNNPSDLHDYVDFNIKNIRKLQVLARRNNNGNLSMILEELEENKDIIDPKKKYVVGRVIHLDTNDKVGNSFKNSILNHIDIACYLYADRYANERLEIDIGTSVDKPHFTSCVHLLRLEKVPFYYLFYVMYYFFKSKKLFSEWIDAQFKKSIK